MGLKAADWVLVNCATTGNGPINPGLPHTGYTSFSSAFVEQSNVWYSIVDDNGNRESGEGIYYPSTNTLTRVTINATLINGIFRTKNSNPSAVAISLAGNSTVACTMNADVLVYMQETLDAFARDPGPPGPQGPQGPEGPNNIAGYPIAVASPTPAEVLKFTGAAWENAPELQDLDGGNF